MRRTATIVMLFASLALLGAACGDDDDGDETDVASQDDGDGTTTTTERDGGGDPYNDPSSGTSTTTTTTGSSVSGSTSGTVQVGTHPEFGRILVGPNGHTLYLFTNDTATVSACMGGCASAWPALSSSTPPTAGPGVEASKLATAQGQVAGHVVYNGHFLYYFAQDRQPGQANGTSVPNWFAVDPAGNRIG